MKVNFQILISICIEAHKEVKMEKLLLKACQNGQKGVVMAFLKKEGINVNAVDEQGLAPIHYD